MANSRYGGTNPTSPPVGLGPPPRKLAKGKRHILNKEILENHNQLARDGWWNVPNPWMHYVVSQYVNWCHIVKFWSMQKHDTHVKKNATHFSRCKDHRMKLDWWMSIWLFGDTRIQMQSGAIVHDPNGVCEGGFRC